MTSILDSNPVAVVGTGAVVADVVGADVVAIEVDVDDVVVLTGARDSVPVSDAHAPRRRDPATNRTTITRDRGPSVTPSS